MISIDTNYHKEKSFISFNRKIVISNDNLVIIQCSNCNRNEDTLQIFIDIHLANFVQNSLLKLQKK